MERYLKLLSEGHALNSEADNKLQEALVEVLKMKGINLPLGFDGFYACYASGNETVVHYQDDSGVYSGLSDMDLGRMAGMTKEQIYKYFGIN